MRIGVIIGVAAAMFLGLLVISPMLLSSFPTFIQGGTPTGCEEVPLADNEMSTSAENDVPADYLELYKAAAKKYRMQWTVLAAVGKRETNHGRARLPGVKEGTNHAGAAGPMQFLVGTWGGKKQIKTPYKGPGYATDGDGDGIADIYNPADAIPAAARMLTRNGAPSQLKKALFTYNRAMWYVDQVLEIARRYAKDGAISVPSAADPDCEIASAEVPNEIIREIVAYALKQRGKPYLWGGTGPGAFDCSGLIYMAYRSAGLDIPRVTTTQWPFGDKVPKGQEKPGDLLFFNAGPNATKNSPGHVGMVVTKGRMIEARCTRCGPIKVVPYGNRPKQAGFRRMVTTDSVQKQLARLER